MKIDISNGKILGTKRVSANGQVSGFTEHAGRDVLVILPGDDTDVQLDAKEYLEELRSAVDQHMRLAFNEYTELRSRFRTPKDAASAFLEAARPKRFNGLYDRVDVWVREQMKGKHGQPDRKE